MTNFSENNKWPACTSLSPTPSLNVMLRVLTLHVLISPSVDAPMVTENPESMDNITAGMTVSFMVEAMGPGTLLYQWSKDGNTLTDDMKYSGAATSNLMVLMVDNNDEGMYSCEVSNDAGSDTSLSANLTVCECVCVYVFNDVHVHILQLV